MVISLTGSLVVGKKVMGKDGVIFLRLKIDRKEQDPIAKDPALPFCYNFVPFHPHSTSVTKASAAFSTSFFRRHSIIWI